METEKKEPLNDASTEESTADAAEDLRESDSPDSGDDSSADAEGEDGRDEGAEAEPAPQRRKRKSQPEGANESSRSPKKRRKKHAAGAKKSSAGSQSKKRSRLAAVIIAALIVLAVIGVVVTGWQEPKEAASGAPGDWAVGQQVPVEITLVAADKTNLACASDQKLAGKHCEFEAPTKKWSKGGGTDDKSVLRPYTTTDRKNLLAAGIWSEPALSGTLPTSRFSVKCTFVIEGMVSKPHARWEANGQWLPIDGDWYAGTVKDCSLVKSK